MLLGWNLLTMYCRILRFYHQNGLFKEICCISCSLCQGRHARVMFLSKTWRWKLLALHVGAKPEILRKKWATGCKFLLGAQKVAKAGDEGFCPALPREPNTYIYIYIYNDAFKTSPATGLRSWQVTLLILSYTFIYFLECSTAGSFSHLGMFPLLRSIKIRSSLSCESQRTMTLPLTRPKSC